MSNGETGPFCDNPECQYHWKVVDEAELHMVVTVLNTAFSLTHKITDTVQTKHILRYVLWQTFHSSVKKDIRYHLCENCYNVYRMLTGEN